MSAIVQLELTKEDVAKMTISGTWKLEKGMPSPQQYVDKVLLSPGERKKIFISTHNLDEWDSSLLNFLIIFLEKAESSAIDVDIENVLDGIKRLIALTKTSGEKSFVDKQKKQKKIFDRLGEATIKTFHKIENFLEFTGEISSEVVNFFRGKIKLRKQEFTPILQEVGIQALPIVSLISFLVGLIIAFVSILQLEKFGATIYVADLIGIAMMREMGSIMTGVIMSGRTGAAFAATIGSMLVNDEIDALQTTGLSITTFLAFPRIVALTLMMPFLCMFSAFIGIAGGMITSLLTTNLTISRYWIQTLEAVRLTDFFIGIGKGIVFGILIAIIGCLKGLTCGRKAEDVGTATTSAVVTSITAIILADAIFAVIFSAFGI